MELLLTKGAEVNIQDDHGRTALMYAVEHGANDIVRVLVKNNIDPDISDNEGNKFIRFMPTIISPRCCVKSNDTVSVSKR